MGNFFDQFDKPSYVQEPPQNASEPVQDGQDGQSRASLPTEPQPVHEPEPDSVWANMKSPPVPADVPERTLSKAIPLDLDTSDAAILAIDKAWRENDRALAKELAAPIFKHPRFMR